MMGSTIRWQLYDRYGNLIYLTQERWEHIIDPINHPEMIDYETELKQTLRKAHRKQDSLNPQKYRYSLSFTNLVEDNTHIVAIVLFRLRQNGDLLEPNNYVVTAYQKEVW